MEMRGFEYYINKIKEDYNYEETTPNQVKTFEIVCLSNISDDYYNFEIHVDGKISYLTSELPMGGLYPLWTFLEDLTTNTKSEFVLYELEGPEEFIFALKTNNNDNIRLIHISNGWYEPTLDEKGAIIAMQERFDKWDYTVHFDILINKRQFILEFYKELFAMFYNKEIPKYDGIGQANVVESKILRKYFKELSDEDLLSLKNKKSKDISNLQINWVGYPKDN